jgi:hypothetical protein
MSVNIMEILRDIIFTGTLPALLLIFYWAGDLVRDWRNLYNLGMIAADKTAHMGFPPYTGPGCVIIKMTRLTPPRMLYLMISHGNTSCMYQGWNFWNKSKVPETGRMQKRSLKHRQVA